MYRNPPLMSLRRRITVSFMLGFGLFILGVIVQIALSAFGIRGVVAYADDLIMGVLAGILVFAYEQRRYASTVERVRVIAAMNHHVRNALQAITFSPYAEHGKQIELIENAAHRIQWALDEILPGENQSSEMPRESTASNLASKK